MVSTNTWYQYSLCVWATVAGIAAAVFETLSPILNELKEDISCVKSEIANLSETVSHLAEELEYHKNETASELADLGSSLQFIIDNPPIEAVRSAVLRALLKQHGREYQERDWAVGEGEIFCYQ